MAQEKCPECFGSGFEETQPNVYGPCRVCGGEKFFFRPDFVADAAQPAVASDFELPFEPTQDQRDALDALVHWWNEGDSQVFRLFGYAGTGKTTIALHVPRLLGVSSYRFGAFSGKAVNVLQSKMRAAETTWPDLSVASPAACSTLHKLIYGPPIDLKAEKRRVEKRLDDWEARVTAGYVTNPEDIEEVREGYRTALAEIDSRARLYGWLYFPLPMDSPLAEVDLLIADEVSMVSDRMAADILETGVRVIVLGDPEQLPPVNGNGYFVRDEPDKMLKQITRQQKDSPVLSLATRVRQGLPVLDSEFAMGRRADYLAFDQILCWRRTTRWGAVNYVRSLLGRPRGVPVAGDRVMNLANNKDINVFNGQTFSVLSVVPTSDPEVLEFSLQEEGLDEPPIQMFGFTMGFLGEAEERAAERNRLGSRGSTALLTFAQALTVHKAQGSEWPSVLVVDETLPMFTMESKRGGYEAAEKLARRWLYTAVTRARDSVTLVRKS